MFMTENRVRLHDTDSAGLLYFASLFRFVHETFEDFAAHLGFSLPSLIADASWLFVIRHVEADYLIPLHFGDLVAIEAHPSSVAFSSCIIDYRLLCNGKLVATARTVHVTLDKATREKRKLPSDLRAALSAHLHAG